MTIQVRSNEPTPVVATKPVGEAASTVVEKPAETTAPGAAAPGQEAATTSEPVETEGEETETTVIKDGVTTVTKKKGGFQRRIDKLTQARALAQQEVEYWKQQALKGAGATKTDAPVETKPATTEGEPDPAKFETHALYVKALARFEAKQLQAEFMREQNKVKLESEQAKTFTSYQERAKEFTKTHADFDEVLESITGIVSNPTVHHIITSSEDGPALIYELAKNPTEFARICALGPVAAAREMGKFESKFQKPAAASTAEATKTTNAPNPISPVSSSGKTAVPRTLASAKTQAEFEAIWKEERKQKRKQA